MNAKILQKEEVADHKKKELHKKCEDCGRISKVYRMFDIDGKNLVEHLSCLNCGLGSPSIK